MNLPVLKQLMENDGFWDDCKPHGLGTFALMLTETKLNFVDIYLSLF